MFYGGLYLFIEFASTIDNGVLSAKFRYLKIIVLVTFLKGGGDF